MALLEINRDECTGCAVCLDVCPFGSLSLDNEDIAVVDEMAEKYQVNNRIAAYLVAVARVAKAMRLRGWV